MKELGKAWSRLVKSLGSDAKHLSMRPGTTPAKLAAAEKKLKFALPPELRAWLLLHDGQKASGETLSVFATGGHFLSCSEVVDEWTNQQANANPDEVEEKPQDKGRVRWLLSHPKRVPFAGDFEMGGGTFIDQYPAKKGTMDQIISLVSECDFMVLSSSLAEMFERTAVLVEKKSLCIVEDPLRLEPLRASARGSPWVRLLR